MSRIAVGFGLFAVGVALGIAVAPQEPRSARWVSYADVYAEVAPVVVDVTLESPEVRVGSGFAVASDRVVTARHLVVGAERATVRTVDGRTLEARVAGTDARTDLAVLDVVGGDLAPATLGRAADLAVGDTVLAIGNPYGLGHSLAVGVLGSRDRRLAPDAEGPRVDFLQLTLPLNPGNSGGPVFDADGRVVGVLAGTHAQGQAIAFAVPVEVLQDTLPALSRGAQVTRAFLGVEVGSEPGGLRVTSVSPSGPAGRAGVRAGDRLVRVGDREVRTPDALRVVLDQLPADAPVDVVVAREGAERRLTVRVSDRAITPVVASGMTLVPVPGAGGRVVAVRPRSRAERAGIREGDVVRVVAGVPVRAPADVKDLSGGPARVEVLRDGVPVVLQLD